MMGRQTWTEAEDQFLRDWPSPTARGLVVASHAQFGDSRSEDGVIKGLRKCGIVPV